MTRTSGFARLLLLSILAGIAPALARGEGTRPPAPVMPSNPTMSQPSLSPEEKAAIDRKEAEDLYRSAYRDVEKARGEMAEAEKLAGAPDPASAERARKRTESAQKLLRKAVDRFKTATVLAPEYYQAWNMLGYCYRKTGDLEKAFPAYERALKLKPDYEEAHEYLGEAHLMAGKLEPAQAELAWLRARKSKVAAVLEARIAEYTSAHAKPVPGQPPAAPSVAVEAAAAGAAPDSTSKP